MPQFYENLVARQRAALTREKYREACLIFQRYYGRLRHTPLKGAAAIALCIGFRLLSLSGAPFDKALDIGERLIPSLSAAAALAGFGWLAFYFLFGAKTREADWAEKEYEKSPLPGIEEEITAYRDSFEVKNVYETMTGFWSECGGCCRKDGLLVVNTSLNLSRKMLVFQKTAMADGEYEKLCEHLKSVFTRRYQEIRKGRGNGK